jgi:hypothetical protein
MTNDTIKDEIAYMSSLARDGHKPTYAGGEFLLMAGVIFGGTSFAVAASLAGYLPVPMGYLWLGAMVAFGICLPILIVRSRRNPAFRMLGNRTVGQAWTAIGWAIFTIAVCSALVGWRLNTEVHLSLFASIILALYGVGWSVSAALSERPWNNVLAVGSFVGAVVVASLVKWPALMFVGYGVALVLLAGVPGAIWMRLSAKAQAV